MSLAAFNSQPERMAAVVLVWMEKLQHHEGIYYSRRSCAAGVESSSLTPWELMLHLVALKGRTETPKPSRVVQPSAWRQTNGMEWCGIR